MVLRRHIRLLQRAIDAYPIWGVRAFIDALHDASGDLVAGREIAEKGEAERSVVESLKTAWRTVNDYVAEVDKVRRAGVLLGYAGQAVAWLQQHHP